MFDTYSHGTLCSIINVRDYILKQTYDKNNLKYGGD